jgi:hypothetical protein
MERTSSALSVFILVGTNSLAGFAGRAVPATFPSVLCSRALNSDSGGALSSRSSDAPAVASSVTVAVGDARKSATIGSLVHSSLSRAAHDEQLRIWLPSVSASARVIWPKASRSRSARSAQVRALLMLAPWQEHEWDHGSWSVATLLTAAQPMHHLNGWHRHSCLCEQRHRQECLCHRCNGCPAVSNIKLVHELCQELTREECEPLTTAPPGDYGSSAANLLEKWKGI